MVLPIDELTAQALRPPAISRAALADRLVESLADSDVDDIHRLWAAEAIRRRDEVRSGAVKAIPAEQVLVEVRRAVGRS